MQVPFVLILALLSSHATTDGGAFSPRDSLLARLRERFPGPWSTYTVPPITVEMPTVSYPDAQRAAILRTVQEGIARADSTYGRSMLGGTTVVVVDDAEKVRQLVGVKVKGFAVPSDSLVILVVNSSTRSYATHELMHIAARRAWGRAAEPSDWINEGWSAFIDGRCGGLPLDFIASDMLRADSLPSLRRLADEFRLWDRPHAYSAAGSFVGYVYRHEGLDGVRGLWQRGLLGSGGIAEKTAALEKLWRDDLRARYGAAARLSERERQSLKEHGCG